MKSDLILFTYEQGNLLIRLLIAHILADFILRSSNIVKSKTLLSGTTFLHVCVVFLTSLILSAIWEISIIIAISHWILDSIKVQFQAKSELKPRFLFIIEQALHVIIIIVMWSWYCNVLDKILLAVLIPFVNYKFSLILLAYCWLIFPAGYFIKFATQGISQTNSVDFVLENKEKEIVDGGKLIGQFERIIILTLVLLNQYEAIGFLITGKSIIRFADHNSKLKSEYVLVGTMMSYAIAIVTGVLVNNLLMY